MFDYKTTSFRTLLIATALTFSVNCAETGPDEDFSARQSQAAQRYQSPDFDKEMPELKGEFEDPDAYIEPNNVVTIPSNEAARKLFESGVARFDHTEPFQQVSWMMVAQDASKLEYRVPDQNGNWSNWEPINITWKEENHYNMLILLDQPVNTIEMRGGEYIDGAEFDFFPVIVAREDLEYIDLNNLDKNITPDQDDIDDVGHEEIINLDEFNTPLTQDGEFRSVKQAVAPASMVISRTAWKARSPGKICGNVVKPYRMAIHHTSSPSTDGSDPAIRMRSMQNYHMDTQKWCDIGYHFVVSQSGKIYQGRSRSDRPGAHVGNQNHGNVGISFIANFQSQTPTATQLNAGAKIMKWVHDKHGVPLNRTAVKGHREHAGASTDCPGKNMVSQLQKLIDLAKGNSTPPVDNPKETYKTDIKTKFISLENFYTQGTSEKIADAMVGQTFQTEILVTNQSSGPIRKVLLNYFIEAPYISATKYVIQSDFPKKDKKTWVVNDANDEPDNPAKNAMGKSGTLNMNAFSSGETKRVLIDIKADRYSVGLADHPDIRAWLTNVDGVYKQAGWNDAPSLNKLEGTAKSYAQLDILSPNEWQFASTTDKEGLEGWTGHGDFDKLSQNINSSMLAQHITGKDSGLVSPDWTKINADTFDQLVFRARSHGGDHVMAIYWARDGESFSQDRVVRFMAKGDSEPYPYVIPMGTHPEWNGTVTKLRIDQLENQAPREEESGWYDLAGIYFQSSADKKTTSKVSAFEPTAPVKLLTGNENTEPPGSNNNNNNPGASEDPKTNKPGSDGPKAPGGSGEKGLDSSDDGTNVGINTGCSTVAVTTTSTPLNNLLFIGLGLLGLSFIRRRF